MVRIAKIASASIGLVLTASLLALFFTAMLNRSADRIIWQSCQPAAVKYESGTSYCLYVVEESLNWARFPYTVNRRYYLFIGSVSQGKPIHGHYKEYSFTSELEDIDRYLQQAEVEWNEQGLTFKEKSGHRLFFPKASFLRVR